MLFPVVIVNPAAGRGARLWPRYGAQLRQRGARICATTRAGDARELALRAIAEGSKYLVAAGGDGTLGEVAGAILESGQAVRLGVLPIGTGNDFARTLGVWGAPERALEAIFGDAVRRVDAGIIECDGKTRAFVNVAGCGFDSLAARRINEWGQRKTMRHVRGLGAYLLAVACEMAHFRAFDLALELDGEALETRAVLCAVANARSYGGGMMVCPDAQLDDGLFDVCIIGDASRAEFLRAFPGVFAGKHTSHPKVLMRQCRKVHVQATQRVPVLADGEIVGEAPFGCEVIPGALEMSVFGGRG